MAAKGAMPEIPFTRVVSVSSEDPRHPAQNLLDPDGGGKWRGAAAGEKQLSVVLELGGSRPINSLHIGNDGAAFVEVLGGSSAGGDFQVLLPSSALMSPSESRAGTGPRRVRLFGPEHLVGAKHPWDRLKVVLSQPYCQVRHPWGVRHTWGGAAPSVSPSSGFSRPPEDNETPPETPVRRLGPFVLRGGGGREPPPAAPPGPLFYQRPSPSTDPPKDPPKDPPGPSYAVAALQASAGSAPKGGPSSSSKISLQASAGSAPKAGAGSSPKPPKRRPPPQHQRHRPPPSSPSPPGPPGPRGPPGPPPGPPGAPGGAVLGGVVLVLSGFQNPLRGQIRAAAVAMGAQYRPDWTPDSTHLVCAFPRTPKAARARQLGGVVVGPDWVWDCQREQRRLPCGPYLLDGSASSGSEEEEEEEPEDAPPPPRPRPSPNAKKVAGATSHPPHHLPQPRPRPPESGDSDSQSEQDDPYGGSTEENSEEGEGPEEPIPPLPDFFEDKTFFLHGAFPEGEGRRLRRLIIAFGGTLSPSLDDSVTHVVTAQDWDPRPRGGGSWGDLGVGGAFQEALELRPSLTFVRPHWLELCGERQRPLPAAPFAVGPRA
ncbi:DNA repair protein XRCC1-like [Manacus candei]|uniref:DNA repair protein XRCC1-like n=1 Tax=Manacus candei TaxID=415023 RepID=UPI002227938B|nr:DNA repair protein XRCC1-like [Manacus candei]